MIEIEWASRFIRQQERKFPCQISLAVLNQIFFLRKTPKIMDILCRSLTNLTTIWKIWKDTDRILCVYCIICSYVICIHMIQDSWARIVQFLTFCMYVGSCKLSWQIYLFSDRHSHNIQANMLRPHMPSPNNEKGRYDEKIRAKPWKNLISFK